MIEALIKILDRLIELRKYQGERLHTIFDRLVEPTFNDLLLIHGDYIEMFGGVVSRLPTSLNPETSEKDTQEIQAAIAFLAEKRREFEPARMKLRAFVAARQEASVPKEIADFFDALAEYFPIGPGDLSSWKWSHSAALLERLRSYEQAQTSRSGLSPTQKKFLPQDPIAADIKKEVLSLQMRHVEAWSRVCAAFAQAKVAAATYA